MRRVLAADRDDRRCRDQITIEHVVATALVNVAYRVVAFTRFYHGSVDIVPGSVDTSVSTQSQAVSTLVSVPRRTVLQKMGQCVDTLPGGVDILQLKLKNVNFSGHVAVWELGDLT
ncbi:hypothetical protein Taro_030008 [Colocasia esculenta]|uniref:Uncharacterized protein n=1 Tax=Colocasia esculenta TaxID=4460 RepID=A0A843VLC2_COLES|nr:hypothetical protein [Colocasia esculenta]